MKLTVFLFLLLPSLVFCSEVNIGVSVSSNEEKESKSEISLIVEITNNSNKEITLDDLNGDLIGGEIELWSLGKGIKVRQKSDAEWRRHQAFASWGIKKLEPGQKAKYVFKLKELLPDDPGNDDFSQSIIKNIEFLKSGKGRVTIEYRKEEMVKLAQRSFEIDVK